MFDKFENHELDGWGFNKLFLKTIWKRISSEELDEYFNEYVKKYTLTEKKIKKIISRTVRNVFRSNDDIETNKINEIQSQRLKDICRRSFTRMQEYMQYMLNTVIKEIELDDGNDEKKSQLINVLKQNCQVLNALQDDEINKCVDEAIAKYNKQKNRLLSNIDTFGNKVGQPTTNINPVQPNDANKTIHEDNGANSTNNTPTYTLYDNFCKNPYIGWDEHGNWHCCL